MQKGILLRINELALKSDKKQSFFVDKFLNSLTDVFKRNNISGFSVNKLGFTFFIAYDDPEVLVPILRLVPGIELFSLTYKFSFDSYEALLSEAFSLSKEFIVDKTFRVTTRRFGKHDFSSMKLSADLGEKLMVFSKAVDLHNPEVTVFLEVRNSDCYVHFGWLKGLGGMPAGSSGKALVLFSGGIDCPVAMFQMLKKGVFLDAVFINMTGESVRDEVFSVYNFVIDKFAYSYVPKLFEIDGREISSYLAKHVSNSLRQQALKIVYYLVAKSLLKKTGSWAVVTGESLSQKSSQTMQSLDLIQFKASPLLVLRPLLAYDKNDIVKIARDIGTFAASSKVKEQCNISSGRVTAIPHPKDFDRIPDLSPLVDSLLNKITIHSGLIDVDLSTVSKDLSFVDGYKNSGFVLVDLRPPFDISKQPLKDSIVKSFDDFSNDYSFFEKGTNYLLVCSFGVQSKELAFQLKKRGFKAEGISFSSFKKLFL